jgi:hypothetical protein
MEGSAQTEREPQESETDLEQPDHRTPPCRLESIHIRRFLNHPIIKMETSFAFSERVRSWLQSEDASERDPAASYAIFKRFIEYEEVEPITTWTPKLDSEATWLHRDPQYLGQAARKFERRVKSIKPEAFFDARMKQYFEQSAVQGGNFSDFVYTAVAARYRESCFSRPQHPTSLFGNTVDKSSVTRSLRSFDRKVRPAVKALLCLR